MKRCGSLILGLALAGSPMTAWAGGVGSSGGGVSVVCRDSQGLIQYAELLDLYEARTRYARVWASTGTLKGDYFQAVKNTYLLQGAPESFGEKLLERVERNLGAFFAKVRYTAPGERLAWLGDTGHMIAPIAGCAYEQLAIFDDASGVVSVDSEIWMTLKPQSQAALVQHELYYKYERELEETTSERTRELVAMVFAEAGAVIPVHGGLPAKRSHCHTSDHEPSDGRAQKSVSSFYVYPSFAENGERTGLFLQFTHLMGRPMLSQTRVRLKGWDHWNLGLGDPEHQMSFDRMVVHEKGANRKVLVPLEGEHGAARELEIEYVYRQPVRMTLLQKFKPVQSSSVDICSR
jgi:hypothetical protein